MTFLAKPSGGQLAVDVELVPWIYIRCTYLDCHIVAYKSVPLLATHRHSRSRGCSCFVQSPGKPYSSKRATRAYAERDRLMCPIYKRPQTNRMKASKSITTDIRATFGCSPVNR